ncbi:MAG: hypothetical protein ACOX6Y_05510 [Christensenellales bacterium]
MTKLPASGTFVLGVPGVMGVWGSTGTLGRGRAGIFPGSSGNLPPGGSIGFIGILGNGVGVGVVFGIGIFPGSSGSLLAGSSIGFIGILGNGVGVGVIFGIFPGSIGIFPGSIGNLPPGGSIGFGVGVGGIGIFPPGIGILIFPGSMVPAETVDAVRVINSSATNNRDNTFFIAFTFLFNRGFISDVSTGVNNNLPNHRRTDNYPLG